MTVTLSSFDNSMTITSLSFDDFMAVSASSFDNFMTIKPWASYQIRKIASCACAGNAGNVFPRPPRVSDPDMHDGTCVTHVPWCIPGSLTRGFLWSRWRGKRSRHSRRMRNPQSYIFGKRPMTTSAKIWAVVCVHIDMKNIHQDIHHIVLHHSGYGNLYKVKPVCNDLWFIQ